MIQLMEYEFQSFRKAYPQMQYLECRPKFDLKTGKVVHPTKQQYLDLLKEVARQTKNNYFGLYFTGSTIRYSGDWAVAGQTYE
jgi:hypothetical protein